MTKIVRIAATVEETTLPVDVTGVPGGAGVAVAYTTKSTAVTVSNNSLGADVQYKIGSGSWLDLERGCGADVAINFSATSLYLRRATLDGGPASVSLNIEGLPTLIVGATSVFTKADARPIPLSGDLVVTAQDDGKVYACTTALTMTFPAGLSPRPAVVGIPPPTGNLSFAVSGGAQVNGATSTLTRSRSSNPAGVVIQPYVDSDGYGASGS